MTSVAPASASTEQSRHDHRIRSLPVLVLFPHNRCNCRCVMCDIWRLRQVREITASDLERLSGDLQRLGVRWIVLSGGEPLMHSDLAGLCRVLRRDGVRITILSTGILLKARARLVADSIDDVIVSLDGPPEVHDLIRNVPKAFARLADGVKTLRELEPAMAVSARCTVQKANRSALRRAVDSARDLGLNSISFLAADVTSSAFNRPDPWSAEKTQTVALDARGIDELDVEIEAMIREYDDDLSSGFIAESAPKLRRIAIHFRARLGQVPSVSPRCNAPWVSSVIEADGTVRPCFFQPAIGQLNGSTLEDVLNSEAAIRFRSELDVATDAICRKCVCSLYLPEGKLREPASNQEGFGISGTLSPPEAKSGSSATVTIPGAAA